MVAYSRIRMSDIDFSSGRAAWFARPVCASELAGLMSRAKPRVSCQSDSAHQRHNLLGLNLLKGKR
ncbi:3-hydroxy-3-methylglutaryl-coenzyme A reductase [Clarias magur]|uniref:3-hydroxy-3-methylglutaryl-coenzyme A reductase n=1 Tax=Clarias magur TaxID=1594786 RepID=A0A8J4THL1_CLAMG|nr:3-hydroxy-3-methylglutaryl-coenzyme A reductase [Clarias magur]